MPTPSPQDDVAKQITRWPLICLLVSNYNGSYDYSVSLKFRVKEPLFLRTAHIHGKALAFKQAFQYSKH